MLDLEDRVETPESTAPPPSGLEILLACGFVVGFIGWVVLWVFWLQARFNVLAAPYIASYPAILPIAGVPAFVGVVASAIYKRDLPLLGKAIGFALLMVAVLLGLGTLRH